MTHQKARSLFLAALLAAGFSAGCSLELPKIEPEAEQKPLGPGGAFQDPSLDAYRVVEDTLVAAGQFDLKMPKPPTAPAGGGLPPPPGGAALAPTGPTDEPPSLFCDAKPAITFQTVCGTQQVSTAAVTWSGCKMPAPQQPAGDDQQQQQQQPPQEEITTSGAIDTEMLIDAAACSPVTEVTFTRNTTFSITRKSSRFEVTASGEVAATGTQKFAPEPYTRTMSIDVTSSSTVTDGTRKGFALKGDVTLNVAVEPGKPPVTGIDATLERTGEAPESYVVSQLERPDPKTCRWPMKGEIKRTLPTGESHVLTFGPSCGDATVDGKKVSLNPQQPQEGDQQPPQGGQQPPPQ